jgi:hypothetical protein
MQSTMSLILCTSALALSACDGSTPTAARNPVLLGRWASPRVEFVAINAGAELTDGCNTVAADCSSRGWFV